MHTSRTNRRLAADTQLEAIWVPVHHAQVRPQAHHIAVHVCNAHLAPHQQTASQVGGLAWVHLHQLMLTGEDLCENLQCHGV